MKLLNWLKNLFVIKNKEVKNPSHLEDTSDEVVIESSSPKGDNSSMQYPTESGIKEQLDLTEESRKLTAENLEKDREFLEALKKYFEIRTKKDEEILGGGKWEEKIELLRKTIINPDNPREDDPNKKDLFSKSRHPHSANFYKDEWSFIENDVIRANIAYQMQFIEWCTYLANDYKIYLAVESLLMKYMTVSISSVIEAALKEILSKSYQKAGMQFDPRREFRLLIRDAYDMREINVEIYNWFNKMRVVRNNLHLASLSYKEYAKYSPDEVNNYLVILEQFRSGQKKTNARI